MTGPSKAEVWQIDLSGSRGHEQKNERPGIIWRDLDHIGMAVIIPFTKSLERAKLPHTYSVSPNSKNGLDEESVALVFQITTIDKRRLIKKLGELEKRDVMCMGSILKEMLKV